MVMNIMRGPSCLLVWVWCLAISYAGFDGVDSSQDSNDRVGKGDDCRCGEANGFMRLL